MREGDGFRVAPRLRQMVLFTRHNLLADPPFLSMDLVTCRNLLIYLDQPAQDRAIARLHFALREGGLMFLGSSEHLGRYAREFDVVDRKLQFYRKQRDTRLLEIAPAGPALQGAHHRRAPRRDAPAETGALPALMHAYDVLLERRLPPGFLINERGEVLHSFHDAHRLIRLTGRMPFNLFKLTEGNVQFAIQMTMLRAKGSGQREAHAELELEVGGQPTRVTLEVEPLCAAGDVPPYFAVLFEEPRSAPPAWAAPAADDQPDAMAGETAWLRRELTVAQQSLRNLMQEVGSRNEELQTTNEELVAANEELQSTNEELQSVNEELQTVNTEFQRKIADLQQLSDDMDNLLASIEIGTLFIDVEGRIRKFTPAATQFFSLIDQDIGRPLADITQRLEIADLPA